MGWVKDESGYFLAIQIMFILFIPVYDDLSNKQVGGLEAAAAITTRQALAQLKGGNATIVLGSGTSKQAAAFINITKVLVLTQFRQPPLICPPPPRSPQLTTLRV